jgi:hypothetical protein
VWTTTVPGEDTFFERLLSWALVLGKASQKLALPTDRATLVHDQRGSLPGEEGGCCHIVGNFPSLVARFELAETL